MPGGQHRCSPDLGHPGNGVAACVKHFACDNQELNRSKVDALVPERALREIYLSAFEMAVHTVGVLTVMNG